MRWRYWFIELPARIVDVWFTIYWAILTVIAVAMLLTFMASMVLLQFGIRWGW